MGILGDIFGSNSKSFGNSYSGSQGTSENSGSSTSTSSGTSSSNSYGYNNSGNTNLSFLNSIYGAEAKNGVGANNYIAKLLGLNGGTDQAAAQANFRNTPGYQFLQDEGSRQVNGSYAGGGALQSGAAMKALQDRAMGIADQTYGSYMDRLLGLGNSGQQAGQLLAGAGQYSTGATTSGAQSTQNSASTSQNAGSSQNSATGYSTQGSGSGSGLMGQLISAFS